MPVNHAYVGEMPCKHWRVIRPDIRLINLETSITQSDDFWRDKGIHDRMHPGNVPLLDRRRRSLFHPGQQPCTRLGPTPLENLTGAGIRSARAGRIQGLIT